MGIEIERKFLVIGDQWRDGAVGTSYRQGYIVAEHGRTVRVRRAGRHGYLTIKGPGSGLCRPEFEYEIPPDDADQMLDLFCQETMIEKIRYRVHDSGSLWEIDEFAGENSGLLLAEIELTHEDQEFSRPQWLGREVTGDARYHNACLSRSPFSHWPK